MFELSIPGQPTIVVSLAASEVKTLEDRLNGLSISYSLTPYRMRGFYNLAAVLHALPRP